MEIPTKKMIERFLQYVKIDTQSEENSDTYPSTLKQLNLSNLLLQQLKYMGLKNVILNKYGYVFATLPANLPANFEKNIPVLGFIAHVDTSPDVSGANVNPIIHRNYRGGKLILPGDSTQIIQPETDPGLKNCIGHDIITSDGTTLLGADNKAGIAEILTAIDVLITHQNIYHGDIRIAFTVDEEIGTGTKHFSLEEFGATYAYTIDGETVGEVEDETFCADTVHLIIQGINIHPGYAKNKMVNAIKIASDIICRLPRDILSPETSEKREGYVHPNNMIGGVEKTEIKFLIRDFTIEGLKKIEQLLEQIISEVKADYPAATIEIKVIESYRNMGYIIEKYPHVVEYALEAVQKSGLNPKKNIIRGGTDGARLSYMGIPTPNIFTGGHNFHSKKEWISVQDMEMAVRTIVNLIKIWMEKGEKKLVSK